MKLKKVLFLLSFSCMAIIGSDVDSNRTLSSFDGGSSDNESMYASSRTGIFRGTYSGSSSSRRSSLESISDPAAVAICSDNSEQELNASGATLTYESERSSLGDSGSTHTDLPVPVALPGGDRSFMNPLQRTDSFV